ncbi:MAG: Hsp20/alpha crystallin family protein [Syntrophomonadaceae bacterium]|nr:Hsp20/alpha crystallin family protein [Syntrophomonadaceae bacterium]
MGMIEWNPSRYFDEFERQMGGFLERTPFRFLYGLNQPRVDVYQTDHEVVVKAELPGMSREDLNVYLDENSIRLSGHRRRREEFKDENVFRSESFYGSFSRTIPLPVEIKAEQARAEYRDGILSITAPKVETARIKGRRIDIQ